MNKSLGQIAHEAFSEYLHSRNMLPIPANMSLGNVMECIESKEAWEAAADAVTAALLKMPPVGTQ
jgi:hypothetical protein